MKWYHLDIRTMTDEAYAEYYAMADEERRRKTDACRNADDRLRSIAGDHLARLAISEHCGVPMETILFGRTGNGKPYAIGLDVHFNISHSGDCLWFCGGQPRGTEQQTGLDLSFFCMPCCGQGGG